MKIDHAQREGHKLYEIAAQVTIPAQAGYYTEDAVRRVKAAIQKSFGHDTIVFINQVRELDSEGQYMEKGGI